ncbi:AAA family ATPase [Endozoicomonas ascidiicola]|uniref:AAA family ATPase n=1 Tax=Endozoicomonas ascidiicola TaxID=1698521 RepID=UPI00082A99B3|nr:AAA family ATPase [Endozoicomonas ascidiicola]
MSSDLLPLLSRGQRVGDTYQVGFLLNASSWKQTYRVTDSSDGCFVLQLFISKENGTEAGQKQAALLQCCKDDFAPVFIADGIHKVNGQPFYYLVQKHISGELLSERLSRLNGISTVTAKHIALALLHGLNSLHSGEKPIICNHLSCQTIMINMAALDETYHLSNFDKAHLEGEEFDPDMDHSELAYVATEALDGKGSVQSDLFSVGVILYRLLYGSLPWRLNFSEFKLKSEGIQQIITKARNVGVICPTLSDQSDKDLFDVVQSALIEDPTQRYQTAKEFINALEGKTKPKVAPRKKQITKAADESPNVGFAAIAGMDSLKETIQTDVIDALNEREKYQHYGLDIPNGMLLYGPPGCGKTFFAERMAEEIGFSLFHLKPSDIQSKWVNATQENIKQLFDKARANAPSIVFIDELDAIVPKRDNDSVSHMNTSAVNEFLAQMNNCGADGVFIVGATNKPESIDPAVMRTGRIDKKIYIPPPDHESRMMLFEKLLSSRPMGKDVDLHILAAQTEDYMSSDIKFICDEAARAALKKSQDISQNDLMTSIAKNPPSISPSELAGYSAEIR